MADRHELSVSDVGRRLGTDSNNWLEYERIARLGQVHGPDESVEAAIALQLPARVVTRQIVPASLNNVPGDTLPREPAKVCDVAHLWVSHS